MSAQLSAAGPPSSSPFAFWSYFMNHRSQDLGWLWSHAWLSVVPVLVGLVIALPLGYLARRFRWVYPPMMSITGLLYTIPSLALFIIVPPLFGLKSLDPLQVPIALTVYSVALLVRVVADGLGSVSDETLQAATAIGYGRFKRLLSVELPIAVPVIAAGLRVATVSNVSLVAIAGTIGQSNLGQLFTQGFQLSTTKPYYPPMVSITGLLYTIPSLALFIIVPPLFGLKSLDPLQVPIALTVYSVALLVRVVADGLGSVSDETLQAATAIGYGRFKRLLSVELPIAVPVIAAGLRVATVSNVSLVAIAGTIGQSNLGQLFTQGFQLSTTKPYYPPIVLGLVLCVLLALFFDFVIVLANRALTPWRRAVPN